MQFTTLSFYAIFIAFIILYAIIRKNTRLGMMLYVLTCSFAFCYVSNGLMIILLLATGMLSWSLTAIMSTKHNAWRKLWLAVIVLIEIFPLAYFKYTNFGIDILNQLLETNFAPQKLILPLGISFYTFQAVSYTIDVYRNKFTLRISLLEYLFYLSFFPTIVAGPITRAGVLIPQLRRNMRTSKTLLYLGLWLLMSGIVKKAILADYIAQFTNMIFDDPTAYSGFENLLGALGYTMQIYLDFSGYSDIAIGMAAVMGFRLKDNFNFPYHATNVSEFWHRWHISLSTWFKDYLYIPLGGNRKGKFLTCLNCLITMLVAGLWHGSTWLFVIWGGIHGLGLILHKTFKPLLNKIPDNLPIKAISWLITFVYVSIAWVYFRSESIDNCHNIFTKIFTDFDIAYLPYFIKVRMLWTIIFVLSFIAAILPAKWFVRLRTLYVVSPWIVKVLLFIAVLQLAIELYTADVAPFIYAGF